MSWLLYCREQPHLGDVPVITDGQASCWKAFLLEQSRSVLKGGHGSKHSVQMLSVLGNFGTACLPNKWEWQYVLRLSLNTDQCVILWCPCTLFSQRGITWDSAVCYWWNRYICSWRVFTVHCANSNFDLCNSAVKQSVSEWSEQVRAGVWWLHLRHGAPCFSCNHNLVGLIMVRIKRQLLTKCG